MEGNFVHRWHSDGGINYGYLLPNGNLLFRDRGIKTHPAPTQLASSTGKGTWSGSTVTLLFAATTDWPTGITCFLFAGRKFHRN